MKLSISATWHMWAFGPSCWLFGKLIVACLTPRSNRLTWMLCLLRELPIYKDYNLVLHGYKKLDYNQKGWVEFKHRHLLVQQLSMVSGSVECMTSNGPQVSFPSWSWDDPHSDRKLRVWSRPSIWKDLVYLQHKTSSGRTNCLWKNHTTCCLGTGWLFLTSMMKWWRSINPVMVMTTSHLLHTVWVANLVAAMAIIWWSNASWPKWSKLWTLLTTRFLRYMASALQSWDWQGEAREEWFCISPGFVFGYGQYANAFVRVIAKTHWKWKWKSLFLMCELRTA